ncbi:MAG TPA: PAS domain S-box protein [Candidatus Cryosericum sp.]
MVDRKLGSGEDSMMQKQANKAVGERQTRFRRISAITSDIAYSCHTQKDGRFSLDWMTGAAERITGYSIEEIKAHGCWRFLVVEEDIPLFEKNVIGLTPGSRGSCELRIRHKNGNTVWISSFAECAAAAKIPGRLLYGGLTEITERKQVEEKLSASETRYRRLFEAASDGIFILDADTGIIMDVNAFLTEMLGFSREEFLGQHIWDLGFFKGIVANEADFLKLQQKEYIRYEDMALDTADGRRINVEFVSNLYPVGQRKVIQCSMRRAHLASFPAQNPYPVIEVGTDGAVRYSNPAAMATLARLGLNPDARQFLPGTPEELALLRSQCERNPQTDELHLDGETFIRAVTAPPGGDSLHVYLIDITKRHQAEKALRELGTFNEQIISSATEGIVVYGPDLRYQIWNPYMEKLTGLAASDVLSRQPLELFPFLQEEGVIQRIERVLLGEKVEAAIFPYRVEKSGRSGWTEDVTSPVLDSQGKIVGAIGIVRDITERKQAEEALRDSENKYRLLIENSHDIIYMLDLQGIFTFVSPSWKRILGQNNDAVVGHRFQEFMHPDDIPRCEKFLASLLEARGPLPGIEYRVRNVDGEWKWHNTNGAPIINADGTCTSVVGIASDITERKQAEKNSLESKALLSETEKTAHIGGWVFDAEKLTQKWTEETFHILEIDVTEGEPKVPEGVDFIAPAFRPMAEQGIRRAIEFGEPYDQEWEIITAKGNRRWVRAVAKAYQEQGKTKRVSGSFQDITERKRMETNLQEARKMAERYLNVAAEVILGLDPQGNITLLNDSGHRLLGYAPGELIGKNWFDTCLPEEARTEVHGVFVKLMDGQYTDVQIYENSVITRNGNRLDLLWHNTLLRDTDGRIVGALSSAQDITERRQAEAQLRQSQKMEAIGQLAGGIAHDFNNLLTGILGNIALMRSSLPPADPLLENLNAAETSARQAADLTKGLLAFSRRTVVLPVPMNITAVLDATLTLLKQSLPATMEIVRDYEQTAWNVQMDQSQMTQILLNLAVNARDAMDGKGTLTIRASNEVVEEEYVQTYPYARTGEFVHLSVTDTGSGMSTEVMQHLFEPFYTTKPVGSGTGLGLSIVYGAIKQADGWITGVSTEGVGTTFDIYLPRCLEEATQPFIPSPLPVSVGSGTILVVEDEPVVCAVARALLSRSGYTVLTAPDGASALNVLRDDLADIGLILLDMTMPGMTTDEIVRGVRALDPTLPILLTSGYASSDTVRQMVEEGSVQGFLGKPYTLAELVGKVQELLHRS